MPVCKRIIFVALIDRFDTLPSRTRALNSTLSIVLQKIEASVGTEEIIDMP